MISTPGFIDQRLNLLVAHRCVTWYLKYNTLSKGRDVFVIELTQQVRKVSIQERTGFHPDFMNTQFQATHPKMSERYDIAFDV